MTPMEDLTFLFTAQYANMELKAFKSKKWLR